MAAAVHAVYALLYATARKASLRLVTEAQLLGDNGRKMPPNAVQAGFLHTDS
jgi:hypothetical protein